VMEGILLGAAFSIVLLLRAFAFPPDAVLGRTPDGEWHDPAYRPDAQPVPRLLVYRFSALLFCANCNLFRDRIEALIATAQKPVQAVVIDCGAIHDVDIMACEMLATLDRELGERGIRLVFGNLRDRVKVDIVRALEISLEGNDPTYPTVAAAAQAMKLS
jgi:sulfate permease, SulP family